MRPILDRSATRYGSIDVSSKDHIGPDQLPDSSVAAALPVVSTEPSPLPPKVLTDFSRFS